MRYRQDVRRLLLVGFFAWILGAGGDCLGQTAAPINTKRTETLENVAGRRLAGRLIFDPNGRLAFRSSDGSELVPEDRLREVVFDGPEPRFSNGTPPFQAVLAPWGRISGRLIGVESRGVRIAQGAEPSELAIAPGGVSAVVQRPGEGQVLRDGFESIDLDRWSQGGSPALTAEPHLIGDRALRLPAGGSSITTRIAAPPGSGRLELAFFDDGSRAQGQRWFVDLTFRRANSELATIRVVLGWAEETLAVETPGGPALNVQPLIRKTGWRRLAVKFDDRRAGISVDGDELAHGQGLGGPLSEIRIATEIHGASDTPAQLAAIVDDLRLVRFAEPSGRFEIEPAQDEVRLITGDQLFGSLGGSDADRTTLGIDGRDVSLSWSDVSGIYFRRRAISSEPIEGKWVRAEWRSAPGDDPLDLDRLEAAVVALDDVNLTLLAPYIGRVILPRDRLRRVEFLARCRRILIDPTARHLGDRVIPDLDPPQPEPTPLSLTFDLKDPGTSLAMLVLDVVQVIGEEGTPVYSELVKKGELRTKLALNGRPLDDLNVHVTARNETTLRVRLPVPRGVLVPGRNVLTITQTGSKDDPNQRDNLGLSGVALEFNTDKASKP